MADGGFVGKQKHTKVFAAKKDSPQHNRTSLSHGHKQQSEHHDKKSHPKVCFLMALLCWLLSLETKRTQFHSQKHGEGKPNGAQSLARNNVLLLEDSGFEFELDLIIHFLVS